MAVSVPGPGEIRVYVLTAAMWVVTMRPDMFKPTKRQALDRGVDRVDDEAVHITSAPLVGVATDPGVVAKCGDRVESREAARSDTSGFTGALAAPGIAPGARPTCAATSVVLV